MSDQRPESNHRQQPWLEVVRTLRWPVVPQDYQLQATANLGSAAEWQPLAVATEERNGYYYVDVPIEFDQMFFRLSGEHLIP